MTRWLAAFAIGAALGTAYFGGLWLTLLRLGSTKRPGLLVLGSYVLRLGGVTVALWLLVGWGIGGTVAALLGLVSVRTALIRLAVPREPAVEEAKKCS